MTKGADPWLPLVHWLALLSVGGCSVALQYEDPPQETGAACSDGIDNDLDGQIDCLDVSCASALCDEGLAFNDCTDQVDNDLDGLMDRFDPSCWRFGRLVVERCATVPGTTIPDLQVVLDDWTAADRVPDPRVPSDPDARQVLALPADGGPAYLVQVLTGARVPLELSATFHLTSAGTISLALRGRGQAPDVLATVDLEPDGIALLSIGVDDGLPVQAVEDWSDGLPGLWSMNLSRTDERSLVFAAGPRGRETTAMLDLTATSFGDAPAFDLQVAALSDGARAHLVELRVDREPHEPCRTPMPPPDAPVDAVVHALAGSEEELCLIVEDRSTGQLSGMRAARDPGFGPIPSFTTAGVIDEAGSFRGLRGWLIDWDPRGPGRYVGAFQRSTGSDVDEVLLVESADCASWTVTGAPGPAIEGDLVGYAVEDLTGFHRVLTSVSSTAGDAIHRWRSPDGSSGTFVDEAEPVSLAAGVGPRPTGHATTVGGHLLLTTSRPREGSIVTVNRGGGLSLLAASGVPGTFDQQELVQGVLWLEPLAEKLDIPSGLCGLLAYTARPCNSCPASLGVARLCPIRDLRFPVDALLRFGDAARAAPGDRPY